MAGGVTDGQACVEIQRRPETGAGGHRQSGPLNLAERWAEARARVTVERPEVWALEKHMSLLLM